jgi:predicted DCC family thiol-disulfide oxidoreductase YuxK
MADPPHTPATSQGAHAESQRLANPPPRGASSESAIVLFDGACNLCDGFVWFIIRRDPAVRFRFASLQSAAARELLAAHDPGRTDPGDVAAESGDAAERGAEGGVLDTVVLLQAGRVYVRSGAALRILRGLGFPWSLLSILLAVPRPLRDALYDGIARRRYRWFGRRDACAAPPELRSRFLDHGDG